MDNYNILFCFPYKKRYYLLHPWKFFITLWRNIKSGWQRATKGYCHYDLMDMDDWLLHMISHMLRDMGNDIAYPGNEEFPTMESWQKWLNNLAAKFESARENSPMGPQNEFEKEWHALLWNRVDKNPNITTTIEYDTSREHYDLIRKQYFEREKEIYEERNRIVQEAFTELVRDHHFFSLWI